MNQFLEMTISFPYEGDVEQAKKTAGRVARVVELAVGPVVCSAIVDDVDSGDAEYFDVIPVPE